jgi:quercetin dioxygenase-like cupin family protein
MVNNINPTHQFTYDGAQLNIFHANLGEGLSKHSHVYSHATVCHNGSCLVTLEGRSYIIDKNSQPLNLPGNQWHEIEALENNTVFCNVFAEGKFE